MELLEKHFEIALETPDGIKKLRELIFSLAMQGKLVPQDPKDLPASELLKDIETEKLRLVNEGKIKKLQSFVPIKQEETPYELPTTWEWTRFKDLAVFINGDRGKNYPSKEAYEPTGVPFINAGHLISGRVDITNMNYINEERYNLLNSGKIQQDDILYCLRGSLGKTAIVKNIEKGAIASSLVIVRLFMRQMADYCYYYLISPFGQKMILDYDNGSAQPNLSANNIQKYLIPIPSLSEQKRIVSKINQLMALCDKLEAERTERNSKRLKIHTAAINKLLNASAKPEFKKSWNFITKNFSELYSVSENVEELKKAILQLAVMGKLVPEDTKDQPASELLNEIEIEKIKEINKGIIREQDHISPATKEELPFLQLPKGWEWCKIYHLGFVLGGKRIPKGYDYSDVPTPHRYLTVTNMKDGTIVDNNSKYINEEVREIIKKYIITKDDIYITIAGTIGAVGTVPQKYDGMNLTENAARLIFYKADKQFLVYLLQSSIVQEQFFKLTNKMAQPKLSLRSILNTVIPLPPLEEQKRIVAKIDQLMGLCNTIQQQLNDSTKKKTAILNSVLQKY